MILVHIKLQPGHINNPSKFSVHYQIVWVNILDNFGKKSDFFFTEMRIPTKEEGIMTQLVGGWWGNPVLNEYIFKLTRPCGWFAILKRTV